MRATAASGFRAPEAQTRIRRGDETKKREQPKADFEFSGHENWLGQHCDGKMAESASELQTLPKRWWTCVHSKFMGFNRSRRTSRDCPRRILPVHSSLCRTFFANRRAISCAEAKKATFADKDEERGAQVSFRPSGSELARGNDKVGERLKEPPLSGEVFLLFNPGPGLVGGNVAV